VTKERENMCEKEWEDYMCKRWVWWRKPWRDGGYGAKVVGIAT
jgi:hypothetical protein